MLRYDSRDPAAARARVGELAAELFGEELHDDIEDFTARLPDALVDEFLQLLLGFDSHIIRRELNRENVVWEAVTAHLPGLAPALGVLRAHLQEDVQPACEMTSEWCDPAGQSRSRDHCRIAHEVGYASYPAAEADREDDYREAPPLRDAAANRTGKLRNR